MIKIERMVLGPISNNSYIIYDGDSRDAVVVDPAIGQNEIYEKANALGVTIREIWITHPHFDHIGGVAYLLEMCNPKPKVMLHENGVKLWEEKGGANLFNFPFPQLETPSTLFNENSVMKVGATDFVVIDSPGHTESDCCFYNAEYKALFSGDVLFSRSIGRTDLPGGDTQELINNIHSKLFVLPDETIVYPGHGALTTIGREKKENPFL